jgi:hypothetical protein
MILRILIVAALAVAVMVAVKDGRILRHAGLTASCQMVGAPTPGGTVVEACSQGKLEGRPDLSRHGCKARGINGRLEYWDCPATVGAGSDV